MFVNSLSFSLQITARQWVVFAHKSPKDAEYLLEFWTKEHSSRYLNNETTLHIWHILSLVEIAYKHGDLLMTLEGIGLVVVVCF